MHLEKELSESWSRMVIKDIEQISGYIQINNPNKIIKCLVTSSLDSKRNIHIKSAGSSVFID